MKFGKQSVLNKHDKTWNIIIHEFITFKLHGVIVNKKKYMFANIYRISSKLLIFKDIRGKSHCERPYRYIERPYPLTRLWLLCLKKVQIDLFAV